MRPEILQIIFKGVGKIRPALFRFKAESASLASVDVRSTSGMLDIVHRASRRTIRISRDNAVYLADIINAFDYYYDSAAPISARSGAELCSIVDFSTPRFHAVAGFPDFPIMCPSLTEPFVTARQYVDFAQLREGDVVVDCGSYAALTSIVFSKAVGPTGKVIALEPDPLNYQAAQTNIEMHKRINGLDNITLMQAAISDHVGSLKFCSEGAMGSADASIVGTHRGRIAEVACLTLKNVLETNRLDRLDFIKMDIEGSEERAIAGAEDELRRYRPALIIEPHYVKGQLSDRPIAAMLEPWGYRCDHMVQPGTPIPLLTATPLPAETGRPDQRGPTATPELARAALDEFQLKPSSLHVAG